MAYVAEGYSALTAEEKAVYDWKHNMYGGFMMSIFSAITKADMTNLKKLGKAFPVEVDGYIKYITIDGWWENVEAIAKGEWL